MLTDTAASGTPATVTSVAVSAAAMRVFSSSVYFLRANRVGSGFWNGAFSGV